LVLELAPGGELFDILYYTNMLPVKTARTYFYQLCVGLEAIHAANICHRDLKPQNLLLNKRFQLKITDFGLAKIFKDDTSAKQKVMDTTYVGTKGYQAPEILLKRKYTTKCDVFSCGVILFILLTGYPPFEEATGSDGWYRKICQKKYKDFWDKHRDSGVSDKDGSRELIQNCMAYQPMERYKVKEMLNDPWTSSEKLSDKELEKRMRELHSKAVKKKKKDARKQEQLQVSIVTRAPPGSPIPEYSGMPLPPHRIFALKTDVDDIQDIIGLAEHGIGACRGLFNRDEEDEWHLTGHVTRAKDKKTFDIELRVFKKKVSNQERNFVYFHVENESNLLGKLPVNQTRKKGKKKNGESEAASAVKTTPSPSETVRQKIWDRIAKFVDEDYEHTDEVFADDISYDDFDADDFKISIGYEVEAKTMQTEDVSESKEAKLPTPATPDCSASS